MQRDLRASAGAAEQKAGDAAAVNARTPASLEADLDELTAAVVAAKSAHENVNALARRLRENGASWPQLARAAGISQQAAYQRWSPDGNRRHRELQQKRVARTKNEQREGSSS